jgi:hypothetical protein
MKFSRFDLLLEVFWIWVFDGGSSLSGWGKIVTDQLEGPGLSRSELQIDVLHP